MPKWPRPDKETFPLSDREKVIWYMFTLYLPPQSPYHRDDAVFAIFRAQQCPDMDKEGFAQVVRDMATMERNYMNKGGNIPKTQKTSITTFCPHCEKQTIHRDDGTCQECGKK